MRDTDIALPEGIHRAGPQQARKLGAITADAFRHDPFNLWLFGNFAGIENLFQLQAKRIYAPRGFCYTAGNEGACMWMLPGGDNSFGLADYAAFLAPTLLRCGPRAVRRGIRTGKLMERRHPRFQHAYLFSIGVGATSRGTGLGRRLIRPVLDACDLAVEHGADDVAPIRASLVQALETAGLEVLDPDGEPFDPNRHEAVLHEPAADGDEGQVVAEVLRRGYAWEGRVLRPAMVRVRG